MPVTKRVYGGAVNFLNQLKSEATALQSRQNADVALLEASRSKTELGCKTAWLYIADLVKQLNVIEPDGPRLSVDSKTFWPALKLCGFRADFRKKMLRDKEVFDYIALGWDIVVREGTAPSGTISVNFPPDLERVERRIAVGAVKHERHDVRHPEKKTLQAIRFDYVMQARGSLTITADHDTAQLQFRVANSSGFEVLQCNHPSDRISGDLLDEMAKMIVGQPHRFL
jgi:hypothetical protein